MNIWYCDVLYYAKLCTECALWNNNTQKYISNAITDTFQFWYLSISSCYKTWKILYRKEMVNIAGWIIFVINIVIEELDMNRDTMGKKGRLLCKKNGRRGKREERQAWET